MTSSSILNAFAATNSLNTSNITIVGTNNSTAKPKKRYKTSISCSSDSGGGYRDVEHEDSLCTNTKPAISSAMMPPPMIDLNECGMMAESSAAAAVAEWRSTIAVRLLIFLEDCDGTRSVIFDSDKFNKLNKSGGVVIRSNTTTATAKHVAHSPPQAQPPTAHSTLNGISNNFNKNSLSSSRLNSEMITRMVFGSFPMKVSNNVAIKVHALRNSNKAMISNVFTYYHTEKRESSSTTTTTTTTGCECSRITTSNRLVQGTSSSTEDTTSNNLDENQKTLVKEASSNSKPIDITNTFSFSGISPASTTSGTTQTKADDSSKANSNERLNLVSSESCSLSSPVLDPPLLSPSTTTTTVPSSSVVAKIRLNSNSMNSYSSTNSTLNNTTCSSVPASYESYTTIYKRLMRSLSNSLITETTPSSSNAADINHSNPSSLISSSFKRLNLSIRDAQPPPQPQPSSPILNPSICQKCIEENCYPKYKIGVSAIYSFTNKGDIVDSTTSTTTANVKSSSGGGVPIDHLTHFPISSSSISSSAYSSCALSSAASSPSTAHNTNTNNNTTTTSSTSTNSTTSNSSPTSNISRDSSFVDNNNEDFYEFFFSHLPLIEYQFKELRQKIVHFLPAYFANNSKYRKIKSPHGGTTAGCSRSSAASSHRNSISSAGGDNINRSSSSLQSLPFSSSPANITTATSSSNNCISSFSRLVLTELRSFESKFNLLYSAPRLTQPAWLSVNSCPREEALAVTDRLVSELVYLKKHMSAAASIYKTTPTITTSKSLAVPRSAGRLFEQLNMKKLFFYNYRHPTTSSLQPRPQLKNARAQTATTTTGSMLNRVMEPVDNNERTFLSTILSTVLKYHLSWVYTVQPSSSPNLDESAAGKAGNLGKHVSGWTRLLEKVNPYNSLWAQLSDLHGAVNQPSRLVRVCVVGQNTDLVERLLFVLSYFIRCSSSSFYDVVQDEFDFDRLERWHDHSAATATTTPVGKSEPQQTATTSPPVTKVNVSELKFDPLAQFNSLIFNAMQGGGGGVGGSDSSRRLMSSYSSSSSSSCSSFQAPFVADSPRLNAKLNQPNTPKHRRLSSSSNGHNCSAQELPLIGCQMKANNYKSKRMHNNFGFSLLAAYSPEFCFEFVLHGTGDRSFFNTLNQRLKFSKNNSILDCPIDESIYIVVDVDTFEVKVYSSEKDKPELAKPVTMIDSMFESLISMTNMFKSNEFVLLHLEDKLQEFYTKSVTLNKIKSLSSDLNDRMLMDLIGLNDLRDLEFVNKMIEAITIPNF